MARHPRTEKPRNYCAVHHCQVWGYGHGAYLYKVIDWFICHYHYQMHCVELGSLLTEYFKTGDKKTVLEKINNFGEKHEINSDDFNSSTRNHN